MFLKFPLLLFMKEDKFWISPDDLFRRDSKIESDQIYNKYLRPVKKKTKLIQLGTCFICATTHIKCSCGEIISLENAGDGEIFECEGCGVAFQIHYDHDGDGLFEERITLAPDNIHTKGWGLICFHSQKDQFSYLSTFHLKLKIASSSSWQYSCSTEQ